MYRSIVDSKLVFPVLFFMTIKCLSAVEYNLCIHTKKIGKEPLTGSQSSHREFHVEPNHTSANDREFYELKNQMKPNNRGGGLFFRLQRLFGACFLRRRSANVYVANSFDDDPPFICAVTTAATVSAAALLVENARASSTKERLRTADSDLILAATIPAERKRWILFLEDDCVIMKFFKRNLENLNARLHADDRYSSECCTSGYAGMHMLTEMIKRGDMPFVIMTDINMESFTRNGQTSSDKAGIQVAKYLGRQGGDDQSACPYSYPQLPSGSATNYSYDVASECVQTPPYMGKLVAVTSESRLTLGDDSLRFDRVIPKIKKDALRKLLAECWRNRDVPGLGDDAPRLK